MRKVLYLIRGVAGSGKTSFSKELVGLKLEADDYFLKDGEYKFDAAKLGEAHKWCQERCERAMERKMQIAICNTFTQEWEMEPYNKMAEKYGYKVFSIIVENRHKGENVHNVPEEIIDKMKKDLI